MLDISEFLLNDEQCHYQTKPHWIVYGLPSMFASFTVATTFVPFNTMEITLIFAAFTLLTWVFSAVNRRYTTYAITNKRVLKKSGLISRQTSGLLLDKVESVDVEQSIPGRILGYGTVIIRGTGGGLDVFVKLQKPFEFRRQLADRLSQR